MGLLTSAITYRKCGTNDVPSSAYMANPLSAVTTGTTYVYRGECFEILTRVLHRWTPWC